MLLSMLSPTSRHDAIRVSRYWKVKDNIMMMKSTRRNTEYGARERNQS